MTTKLAVITARGGSKRVPRKNIREFLGKPIIAYSIEAALRSQLFDEVMVSTDDEQIAEISRAYGAKVPFFRSEENSNDFATTADVLLEVLNTYLEQGRGFDFICCLYPTAPFVDEHKLRSAYELMVENGFDGVFPVVEFGFPVLRSLQMDNGRVSPVWPEHYVKRSQDLAPMYHDAGQFYWLRVVPFLANGKLVGENTGGIVVDEVSVQDIDTETDWRLAELKYSMRLKKEEKQ